MFTDIALKNAVGHVIPLEQMYRFVMFRCVDVLILMCTCVDMCRFLCVDVQMCRYSDTHVCMCSYVLCVDVQI